MKPQLPSAYIKWAFILTLLQYIILQIHLKFLPHWYYSIHACLNFIFTDLFRDYHHSNYAVFNEMKNIHYLKPPTMICDKQAITAAE